MAPRLSVKYEKIIEKFWSLWEGALWWGFLSVLVTIIQDSFRAGLGVFAWGIGTAAFVRVRFFDGRPTKQVVFGNAIFSLVVAVVVVSCFRLVPAKAELKFSDIAMEIATRLSEKNITDSVASKKAQAAHAKPPAKPKVPAWCKPTLEFQPHETPGPQMPVAYETLLEIFTANSSPNIQYVRVYLDTPLSSEPLILGKERGAVDLREMGMEYPVGITPKLYDENNRQIFEFRVVDRDKFVAANSLWVQLHAAKQLKVTCVLGGPYVQSSFSP